MKKEITLNYVRDLHPCYNPASICADETLSFTPVEVIDRFRNKVRRKNDIVWLICREDFMSDRQLILFAVWCVRQTFKFVGEVDEGVINTCSVVKRYANGQASYNELENARAAAWAATRAAAWAATRVAAEAETRAETRATAWAAARVAAARVATAWAAAQVAAQAAQAAAQAAAEAAARAAQAAKAAAQAAAEAAVAEAGVAAGVAAVDCQINYLKQILIHEY